MNAMISNNGTDLIRDRGTVKAKTSACLSGSHQVNSCYGQEIDQITSIALSNSMLKSKGKREKVAGEQNAC